MIMIKKANNDSSNNPVAYQLSDEWCELKDLIPNHNLIF